MTRIESILKMISELPEEERGKLLELLAAEFVDGGAESPAAVGQRGLAAWTESVRGEDWSDCYPHDLKNSCRGKQ